MSDELKPCPFCGGEAIKDAYDRGIHIGCKPCGYIRHFPGLLQRTPNDKPILEYRNTDGSIKTLQPEDANEFYHYDANERAADEWNRGAYADRIADLERQLAELRSQPTAPLKGNHEQPKVLGPGF